MREIVARGFDEEDVGRVIKLVDAAEYKRRQAPVGIKVTSRAFGRDRRMPANQPLLRARPGETDASLVVAALAVAGTRPRRVREFLRGDP